MHRTAAFLLLSLSGVVLTYPADVSTGRPQDAAAQAGISVASVNLAKETNIERIITELSATPALKTDVLLLQEVVLPAGNAMSVAEELAKRLDYHVVFAPAFDLTPSVREGLAIVSRYPLSNPKVAPLKKNNLRFRTRKRILLAATADTPSGPVRLINAHLDTRINATSRIEQLEPVLAEAAAFNGPKIIGGDFNTNMMRWVYSMLPLPYTHNQAIAVQDYMTKRGYRSPFPTKQSTFDYLGMHLDWIYTDSLEPKNSGVKSLKFSDHHAIWAHFELPGEPARASR